MICCYGKRVESVEQIIVSGISFTMNFEVVSPFFPVCFQFDVISFFIADKYDIIAWNHMFYTSQCKRLSVWLFLAVRMKKKKKKHDKKNVRKMKKKEKKQ